MPRPTPRAGLVVVIAGAILGAVALLSAGRTGSPSDDASATTATTVLRPPGTDEGGSSTTTEAWADGVIDEQDGVIPDGVTVFDDEYPGVANLAPDLLQALRSAATDAAEDGLTFFLHSAWRSPEYQEQLLRDAVSEYGSEEEAARWVASPELSLHVSGDAADIDGTEARDWLSDHGAAYGLCPVYRNEPWHFELRPDAIEDGCPAMYADPTQDPRLQR